MEGIVPRFWGKKVGVDGKVFFTTKNAKITKKSEFFLGESSAISAFSVV